MWDRSENPCSLRGVWQSCRVWEDCILHLTSDLLMLKLLSLRVTSKLSASTLSWAAVDIPCLPCWAFFSLKVIWALAAVIAMQLLAQWLAWRVRTQKGKSETLEDQCIKARLTSFEFGNRYMIYDISSVSLLFRLPCGLRNPYNPRLLHALHLWRRDPSQPKPSRLSTQRGTATMEVEWSSVRSLLKSCSMPASFQRNFMSDGWLMTWSRSSCSLLFITVHCQTWELTTEVYRVSAGAVNAVDSYWAWISEPEG